MHSVSILFFWKLKKKLLFVLGVVVAVVIYGTFDPSHYRFFPRCPFLLVTGLKCPGCGSQRALHCLLHMDVAQAFSYNAFLVVAIPLIVVLSLAEFGRRRYPRCYMLLNGRFMIWSSFTLICGWWLVRNIVGL